MFPSILSTFLVLPLLATAAPTTPSLETSFSNLVSRQSSGSDSAVLMDFPIHESCNASQKMQIGESELCLPKVQSPTQTSSNFLTNSLPAFLFSSTLLLQNVVFST